MSGETLKSSEIIPDLKFGDEVIYLPDGSHQVVTDIPTSHGANLGRIMMNSQGEETMAPPGTVRFDEIGEIVGHWDVDRVADAWFRWMEDWNLTDEVKVRIRTHLQEEAAKQIGQT